MVAEALDHLRVHSFSWGIELGADQLSSLNEYAELLSRYDLANIIGTTSHEDIILEHLIDSMTCFLLDELHRTENVIDVGTGAGLPGIPLAIARPALTVTLLEATEKKVHFLNYAIKALCLENVQVIHARAEHVGQSPLYRGTFELAVARALAALPVLVEYCAPLVTIGGTVLAMKARLSEEELAEGTTASRELKLTVREVMNVRHRDPLQRKERRFVILDKLEATPDRFPRRVGMAKKRPLGH